MYQSLESKLIYNHKIYVDMSIYGHSPSPLKPYSKSNTAFNTNQNSTGIKSQIEKVYTIESPDRQPLGATLDAEYWRRRNMQTEIKYTKAEDKGRKIFELQQKTEVILRHNTHLLAENSSLKDALAAQQAEIQGLRHQLQTVLMEQRQPSFDRILITQQLERKNYEHRIQVQKLLSQISKLHQECFQLQTIKNVQIQRLKSDFQQASYQQIQNLKRSQHGSNEMYELQIRKLKENLDSKNCEMEEAAMLNKREKEVLLEELSNLKADYKLLQQKREYDLQEAKAQLESDVNRVTKEARISEEALRNAHELALKRIRKELGDRLIEIERLNNKIDSSNQENQFLGKQLRDERDRLSSELSQLADDSHNKVLEERARLEKLAEMQINNFVKAGENKSEILEAEIRKLTELLELKTKSVEEMALTAQKTRDQTSEQLAYMHKQNQALRDKLFELNQTFLQDLQLAKVKISQLHQSDIQGLVRTYQPKLQSLSSQLSLKSTQLQQLRVDLHSHLQQKLHLRKQYELQLSKLRTVIMDLRVQLSAVQVEMKENITSLRSKMDFASQSLLNDNQLKVKNMKFNEEEMRKLRQAIEAKDQEIKQNRQNWEEKEKHYENQVARANERNSGLRKELDEREGKRAKEIAGLNQEIEALKGQLKEEKDQTEELISSLKAKAVAAQDEVNSRDDKIRGMEKQIQTLQEKCKKLQHEIGLAHGHLETVRMQSEVNLNDQKQRHHSTRKDTEASLKDYYERRIKELETDKNELTNINSAQADQIRELVVKYNELEKNLKDLLESQKKLTDFENRVLNLGMDQNLIKNMAELLRRP